MDQCTIAIIRASYPLAACADSLSVPCGESYLFNTPVSESTFNRANIGAKNRAVAHICKGVTGVDGQHSKKSRAIKFFSVRKDKRMDRRLVFSHSSRTLNLRSIPCVSATSINTFIL